MSTPHGKGVPVDQQIGGPAVASASPTCGKGRITELEKKLHQYEHTMRLLLSEKKEWDDTYDLLSQAHAQNEAMLKREQAAHLNAISEYEEREDRFREALHAEKQRVAELEKALREIHSAIAEVKFLSQKKIGVNNGLQANIVGKSSLIDKLELKKNELNKKLDLVQNKISSAVDLIGSKIQKAIFEKRESGDEKNDLFNCLGLFRPSTSKKAEHSLEPKVSFGARKRDKVFVDLTSEEKHNDQKDYASASAGHKRTFASMSGATTTGQCVGNTESYSEYSARKRQKLGGTTMVPRHLVSREEAKAHHGEMPLFDVAEADEKAMAKYREDHPEEVQAELEYLAELEFYAKRDVERKKKERDVKKAMAKYREDHPEEVQAELEFYTKRDAERKKERADMKRRKAEMEAQLEGAEVEARGGESTCGLPAAQVSAELGEAKVPGEIVKGATSPETKDMQSGSKEKTEVSSGDDAKGESTSGGPAAQVSTELGEAKVHESSDTILPMDATFPPGMLPHVHNALLVQSRDTPVGGAASEHDGNKVNGEATAPDSVPSAKSDGDPGSEDGDEDGEESDENEEVSASVGEKLWRFLIT